MKTTKRISLLIFITIITSVSSNAQWQQTSMTTGNVNSLAANQNYIFTSTGSLYVTTDEGTSWTAAGASGTHVCVNSANVFTVMTSGFPYLNRSTNNGANWTQQAISAADGINSLAISGNNAFIGTVHYGIRRSTDGGVSWATLLGLGGTITTVAANGNNVFALQLNSLYMSSNNGDNWSPTALPAMLVNSVVINGSMVYAASNTGGVYSSTDIGATWNQSGLNNESVKSLAVNGNIIFAGTNSSGVYLSTNNGAGWVQKNEGLTNLRVDALLISGNYVYAGTYGSGVWKRPLGELVGINTISSELPQSFSLQQNYPNPFNPSTNIKFELPKHSNASLVIYDMLGREIETIINEELNPGTYQFNWNAEKISSGAYYYKLTAGDYTETKKMVLMK